MNVALFDHPKLRQQLLPFTFTRPLGELLIGILTISQKWQNYLGKNIGYITHDYLSKKFPLPKNLSNIMLINGSVCPDEELVNTIRSLGVGQAIGKDGILMAAHLQEFNGIEELLEVNTTEYQNTVTIISRPWHIFKQTGAEIRADYNLLTKNSVSASITDVNTILYDADNIFLEEGVNIKAAILNAENGPIYLGKNSIIEEGAIIRGPFALGEESTINAHARMRGDISIGPKCKVGGEVSNSVIFGHSNKGHDGFLGNSVLGEWCNIGAGTNTSNLKNNYDKIKIWDFAIEKFIKTDEQFCGLLMGDHSKCAINTMFNTATVVGVAANIFGTGFPRTFIPSFSWGGQAGFTTFLPHKVKEMASVSMARRGGVFDQQEEDIISSIFKETEKFRTWE